MSAPDKEPIALSAWSLDQAETMIEEWRNKPDSGERGADYAGKAGAMWVLAFMLMQHIRATQNKDRQK